MFPPVPRGSDAFKAKFKTRTSVERSNKRMFKDYTIKEYDARSSMMRMSLAAFAVVNIHLDAWVKHTKFSFNNTLQNKLRKILSWLFYQAYIVGLFPIPIFPFPSRNTMRFSKFVVHISI